MLTKSGTSQICAHCKRSVQSSNSRNEFGPRDLFLFSAQTWRATASAETGPGMWVKYRVPLEGGEVRIANYLTAATEEVQSIHYK